MSEKGSSTAYEIVRKYAERKIGKFTGADTIINCPSIGRSSVLAALKKLTDEGFLLKESAGRNTFYVRSER